MAVTVNGHTYYRTIEVCRMAGISKNTLFRWIKAGMLSEAAYRDWRGWRLFNQSQVDSLKAKTSQMLKSDNPAAQVG